MKPLAFAFTLLVQTPAPGAAGPWLAESGSTFTSVSTTLNYQLDVTRNTYLEHGLHPHLTLGAELILENDRFGSRKGGATLFLRRPLDMGAAPHLFAYELGLGARWANEVTHPHAQAGLSWGRGFEWRGTSGWATVDSALRKGLKDSGYLFKVDGTIGLNLTSDLAAMGQIYLYQSETGNGATLAPSFVWRYLETRDSRIQIGFETPLDRPERTAAKIGLWQRF
ncbi:MULTISPECIES: hypothetical protein [unclassified Sulfitobacter]|nr:MULTISPECIES: hypothetical protein [unclassified Sulfitobacter]KZY25575.1 hypothetical protein A3728_18625 [Sulfitobacter sp. HI0040]KZZ70237.1 hypothetical protein A3764_08140 [Sulfitobacter sp. HI0129]